MSKSTKLLDLKISLYNILNKMADSGKDLADSDSELLFVLAEDPDLEEELQSQEEID